MALANKQPQLQRGNCKACQSKHVIRTIHLLRMQDEGKNDDAIHSHVQSQFPTANKESVDSEINWLNAIHQLWGFQAKQKKIPVWMAWIEANGFSIERTPHGWVMRYTGAESTFSSNDYIERIWRMQDQDNMPSYNSPDWYLERIKVNPSK